VRRELSDSPKCPIVCIVVRCLRIREGARSVSSRPRAASLRSASGTRVSTFQNDVTGRVTHEWTPDGTAFTSPTGSVGPAIPYDRRYTYDNAGGLTQVNDRTAAQTGIDITATPPSCVTRVYGFDANGNRTSLTSRPAHAGGSCATTNITGTTTTSQAYDSADRLTTGPDTGLRASRQLHLRRSRTSHDNPRRRHQKRKLERALTRAAWLAAAARRRCKAMRAAPRRNFVEAARGNHPSSAFKRGTTIGWRQKSVNLCRGGFGVVRSVS
jgi:hypothetical protein